MNFMFVFSSKKKDKNEENVCRDKDCRFYRI